MAEQSATPAAKGFITRTPPVFDNLDDERQHRIERLAGACRIFGKAGFSQGCWAILPFATRRTLSTFGLTQLAYPSIACGYQISF